MAVKMKLLPSETEDAAFNSSEILNDLNWKAATERIPVIVFIGVLLVLGIAGNSLVIYIFKTKFSSSTYRVFILFLSIIDLTCCCISMPFEIADELNPYTYTEMVSCKVFRMINMCIAIASALALVVIAIERYRKICRPHDNQMTGTSAFFWCIGVVILSVIITFPALYVYGLKTKYIPYNGTFVIGTACTWGDHMRDSHYGYFFFAWVLSVILICMVTLVILYSLIGIRLKRRTKYLLRLSDPNLLNLSQPGHVTKGSSTGSLPELNGRVLEIKQVPTDPHLLHPTRRESAESTHSHKTERMRLQSSKDNRITRTLFAIALVFLLSYLPYIVILIVYAADPDYEQNLTSLQRIFRLLGLRLYMINSVSNPILYGFFDAKFREYFKAMWKTPCSRV